MILSEAVGPLMAAGLLRRVGEIAPEVEEAIEEGDEAKAVARARGRPAPDSTVETEGPGPPD